MLSFGKLALMTSSPEPPSAELDLVRLAEIAVSSMARVDLCRVQSGSHRNTLVAVKRLHDDVADDPEFVRMFRDEVWMTSALLHGNGQYTVPRGEAITGRCHHVPHHLVQRKAGRQRVRAMVAVEIGQMIRNAQETKPRQRSPETTGLLRRASVINPRR